MTADIKLFNDILKFTIKAKDKGVNVPLFVWGEAGVGKTTQITKMAKENDCHLETLHIANQSPETLLGLEHKDLENNQTIQLPPEWLARGMASPKRTIYFLDEINRGPKYVIQGLFSFINEGHLHTHHIKKGDIIIVAGNPDSNDYEVTGFDDKAFISRFAQIYFEPTHDDVTKHFLKGDVHEAILSVIKEDPTLTSTVCKAKMTVVPTNRMLERVGQCLSIMKEEDLTSIGYTLFSGMIGGDTAGMVIKKAKDTIGALPDPDAIMFKGDLSRVRADQMDVVTNTNTRLAKHLKEVVGTKKYKANDELVHKNLAAYMIHVPKDSALAFVDTVRQLSLDVDVITKIIFAMPEAEMEDFLNMNMNASS
jgi:hypothetical protein